MPGDIAYDNLMTASATTLTASSEATGFEAVNLSSWNAYESWKSAVDGTQTINIDLGSSKSVDTFAVFGHNLSEFSGAGDITLHWSNDGLTGWTQILSFVPTDSACIFKTFGSVSKRYFRITIPGTAGRIPVITIAFLGARMTLEKGFRIGFTPSGLFDDAETIQNISDTSLPLGRSVIIKPGKYTIPQTILSPAWVRSDWVPFLEHAKSFPFFFAWDLTNYPDETVFAWTDGKTIQKPRYSHANYMSAALNILTQKQL